MEIVPLNDSYIYILHLTLKVSKHVFQKIATLGSL